MKHNVDTKELVALYASGLTTRQVADRVGVPARTAARYLKRAGADMRPQGPERHEVLRDAEFLKAEYVDKGKSIPQIASETGASTGVVRTWLQQHGIARRSRGSEKGHNRMSEDARRKLSEGRIGRFVGENSPLWRGGSAPDPERTTHKAKQWSKAVRLRDGICQHCGAFNRLHAHHIKRWKDYPELRYDLSNGIALCYTCHEAAHGRGFKFRFNKSKAPRAHSTGTATAAVKI